VSSLSSLGSRRQGNPVQPPLATTLLFLSLTPSNQKWFYFLNSQFTKSKKQKNEKEKKPDPCRHGAA
jgi:hypothetical protein